MITLLLRTLLLICLHLTSVYFTVEKHVCSFPYFGTYSMVNTRLIAHSMDIQATLMSPGRTKHVCCFPYIGSYVLVITRAGLRHFEMYWIICTSSYKSSGTRNLIRTSFECECVNLRHPHTRTSTWWSHSRSRQLQRLGFGGPLAMSNGSESVIVPSGCLRRTTPGGCREDSLHDATNLSTDSCLCEGLVQEHLTLCVERLLHCNQWRLLLPASLPEESSV